MNKIQQWDLRVCQLCLLHPYNRTLARISRLISTVAMAPSICCWPCCSGSKVRVARAVEAALFAFMLELPLYLLLKNSLRRARPSGLPVFITPRIATVCPLVIPRPLS